MIRVSNLTKRYVGRTAVDAISFNVEPGEIVGFLGPNGAGKTTTIRILTGYMPATSGTAVVAGHDIFRDSLKAQQRIGYMPENVPLYDDMRVKEYLRFRALLKGMRGREAKNGIAEAIDLCGLTEMRSKMIGALSKGYRQRVGLADALIHNPDLLILDEPTNGLDPNQIRRVRKLIQQLGLSHTILISTHILSEVEMTCDRVIILDRGKVRAADTPENLIKNLRTAGHISVEVNAAADMAADAIRTIPRVKKVIKESTEGTWTKFTVRAESGADIRESIVALANANHWPLREIHTQGASLEDVFVELTQSPHPD
ncbi:MAG: ATP-binding cassette domain-containing protein [Verrucomicrobiaceae bacterium]|nr:ATP-binding cassette domain-containing protein [Verrucomicrobiaceae bacterium]